MRILLVHPDDSPDRGPWAGQTWDQVIDLSRGGADAYNRWSRHFRCPVISIDSLRLGDEHFRVIRNLLEAGRNCLMDQENLDWWELTAIFFHEQLEMLAILCRFAATLEPSDEVFITRPGFHADALRLVLGRRLRRFAAGFVSPSRGPMRYARAVCRLTWSQLVEICGDKYDPGYALRGVFSAQRRPCLKPVVLLPSAYVNVSRMGMAYATTLPEADFLLVATRKNGLVPVAPPNVAVARLASYARREPATQGEYGELMERWRTLRADVESIPEISLLSRLGFFDSFPRRLQHGLAIRDAWRAVFETEPVRAVLCGDDTNPYTHIPLLLARKRGIPTLACHHGALDGRHLIKQNHSDIILAKGRMEEDYLLRVCGLPRANVEVGAPAAPLPARVIGKNAGAPCMVFFSEAYEVSSGRAEEFYRTLVPPLADLALKTNRKLVIKLHPFESYRERKRLVAEIISPEQQRVIEVVKGVLSDDLLRKTWFGITILSTVAMECAIRGIPCFLCAWLEYWPYGYIRQFSKFRVGCVLRSAAEISQIPQLVASYSAKPEVLRDLWQPITRARFQELVSGSRKFEPAVAI